MDNVISIPKCIFCNSNLTFGLKVGISLSCSHKICFECKLSPNLLECPIDKKIVDSDYEYLSVNLSSVIPNCHNFHSFYNRTSEIYNLDCGHYSCDSCLEFKSCLVCGSIISLPKRNLAIESYISFLNFYCLKHNELAIVVDIKTLKFYCLKCESTKGLPLREFSSVDWIADTLNSSIKDFIKRNNVAKRKHSPSFLKEIAYANVLEYKKRQIILEKLKVIDGFGKYYSEDLVTLNRFSDDLWPFSKNSKKVWEISDGEAIEICIRVDKNIILSGIVIGGSYYKKSLEKIETKNFFVKKIEIFEGNNTIFYSCSLGKYSSKVNNVMFKYDLLLWPEYAYLIRVYVSDGLYFHGKPFKKNDMQIIKVEKSIIIKDHIKNCAIGGPILGFIVKYFK